MYIHFCAQWLVSRAQKVKSMQVAYKVILKSSQLLYCSLENFGFKLEYFLRLLLLIIFTGRSSLRESTIKVPDS